jgi:putative membrane protein
MQPPLDPQPKAYSLTNELAKERNRAAAERTLMAWIRTSLALISFGFGIDQIVAALAARGGDIARTSALSRATGLSFIAVGIYAMIAATFEHRRILAMIQRDDYVYYRTRSLGIHVAIALIGIGVFTFIAIIVDALLD